MAAIRRTKIADGLDGEGWERDSGIGPDDRFSGYFYTPAPENLLGDRHSGDAVFYLRKDGEGHAVVAQLRASDECEQP